MILDDIVAARRRQLEQEKSVTPLEAVKEAACQAPPPRDFQAALLKSGLSVIAEVKKASPSRGLIQPDFHPCRTACAYEEGGADAISVLTESHYFMGCGEYLRRIRKTVSLPILRKDFMIDPYQIYEARALGADAVLLIAALLDTETLREYRETAASLGMAALMEAHSEEELSRVLEAGGDIVGINNRDLKTFRTDLAVTARLAKLVPAGCVIVSESGISCREDMAYLRKAGADAVLIGETLMRSGDIPPALHALRERL